MHMQQNNGKYWFVNVFKLKAFGIKWECLTGKESLDFSCEKKNGKKCMLGCLDKL